MLVCSPRAKWSFILSLNFLFLVVPCEKALHSLCWRVPIYIFILKRWFIVTRNKPICLIQSSWITLKLEITCSLFIIFFLVSETLFTFFFKHLWDLKSYLCWLWKYNIMIFTQLLHHYIVLLKNLIGLMMKISKLNYDFKLFWVIEYF